MSGNAEEYLEKKVRGIIEPMVSALLLDRPKEPVKISYKNAPSLSKDWIGIYHIGDTVQKVKSTYYQYVSGDTGTINVSGLKKGYYYASYFILDSTKN